MFKNLRTSTKLLLLCAVFVGALAVATYGLVAEKQIAIEFVRKELVGVRHLSALREVYVALLSKEESRSAAAERAMNAFLEARSEEYNLPETEKLTVSLSAAIDKLASAQSGEQEFARLTDALTAARNLASGIGDDSNLTLDPDLDSYYVQDIVVTKLPNLLSLIGELQAQLEMRSAPQNGGSLAVRSLVLDGLIRSNFDGITRSLEASYRTASGAHLKQALGADMEEMVRRSNNYLSRVKATLDDPDQLGSLDRSYAPAVDKASEVWAISVTELERLLNARHSDLLSKLWRSLLLNGLLAVLSIALAIVTGRHIVKPLLDLERLADRVGQTKDYNLRSDYESGDEIGRVAVSFNAMLAELAAARERETADTARNAAMQAELARVARITTMGEMAASIAHEINQPLAAIVNNANASLRWLAQPEPKLDRARSAIERVVADGSRASDVIGSIRALLEQGSQERALLPVNDIIREVMAFARTDLRAHGVSVQTELAENLPSIVGVRIQLQQVFLNLIANAIESMADQDTRVLTIRTEAAETGIVVTVADTGTGIDASEIDRIFEAFVSTKQQGMGMGLSICRSIVEAHHGGIAALQAHPVGSVFRLSLPGPDSDK
jgi:signal transduction histidine kinase